MSIIRIDSTHIDHLLKVEFKKIYDEILIMSFMFPEETQPFFLKDYTEIQSDVVSQAGIVIDILLRRYHSTTFGTDLLELEGLRNTIIIPQLKMAYVSVFKSWLANRNMSIPEMENLGIKVEIPSLTESNTRD